VDCFSFHHAGYAVQAATSLKMRLTALATLIIVLTLLTGGVSGQMDCPEITKVAVENVIRDNIPTEDSPAMPTVDVLRFHPVCLAHGHCRDRYRYVSVVVEYTCIGSDNCPSGTAVEQIHSECSSGTWIGRVAGIGPNFRTINTTANFSTITKEDCAFCFSPQVANAFDLTTDAVTHCVGKHHLIHSSTEFVI